MSATTENKLKCDVAQIVRDVRVCLDQNRVDTRLIGDGDEDTLDLDQIIRSKIEYAAQAIGMAAPIWMLSDWSHDFKGNCYWIKDSTGKDTTSGYALLPADFMRLLVFKMGDWETAVYTAVLPGTPEYEATRSRYAGLRGNPQRPVCVLAVRPEGRVLEFHSCADTDATVTMASYLPRPEIKNEDGVETLDISKECYRAVVYMAASLTCTTLRDHDHAGALKAVAEGLLQ